MPEKIKAKIRVCTDQYEFIELDVEGTQDEIWAEYKALKRKTITQAGLETKEWNACLDRYLSNGDMDSDSYERMNDEQKRIIQEIKKCYKRIEK